MRKEPGLSMTSNRIHTDPDRPHISDCYIRGQLFSGLSLPAMYSICQLIQSLFQGFWPNSSQQIKETWSFVATQLLSSPRKDPFVHSNYYPNLLRWIWGNLHHLNNFTLFPTQAQVYCFLFPK